MSAPGAKGAELHTLFGNTTVKGSARFRPFAGMTRIRF